MGTRCLLTQVALLVAIATPAMSFPARSNKQLPSSRDHHAGDAASSQLLRMLTDKILHLSAEKGSRGIADQKQTQLQQDPTGFDQFVPAWPARHNRPAAASKDGRHFARENQQTADLVDATNDGDGDIFTPDVSGLETLRIPDGDKRGSDYGHGMFFGKRVASGWQNRRQGDGERRQHGLPEKRPSDYHWGMMFGKRGHSDTYGWGGFFGKRNDDVIEYDDFVA